MKSIVQHGTAIRRCRAACNRTQDRQLLSRQVRSSTRLPPSVRYLRSMYVPDEETCFVLYEAESAEGARRAAALAAFGFEWVGEVIGDTRPRNGPDGANTDGGTLTADNREGSMGDGSTQQASDDRGWR